jgi:peptide/nickel transport system ATP-binding protein
MVLNAGAAGGTLRYAAVSEPAPLDVMLTTAGVTLVVGMQPSLFNRSSGCAYSPRCPLVSDRCRIDIPSLRPLGAGVVACHNVG